MLEPAKLAPRGVRATALALVIAPSSWLAGANSLREVFTQADLLFFIIAPLRAVHLVAVIAALVFLFLPAANNYFRAGAR